VRFKLAFSIYLGKTKQSNIADRASLPYTSEINKNTEQFTLCDKDNDGSKTANIKIIVLQAWHILH